jgi:YHS domain-containing protein
MRLLIFIAIIYIVYKALKSWMLKNLPASGSPASDRASTEIDDVMVKDPYCEVYFPKRKGIQLKVNGDDLYFCSPECRDKFIDSKSGQ